MPEFNKVAGLIHPRNFAKFLKTPFLQNPPDDYFWSKFKIINYNFFQFLAPKVATSKGLYVGVLPPKIVKVDAMFEQGM